MSTDELSIRSSSGCSRKTSTVEDQRILTIKKIRPCHLSDRSETLYRRQVWMCQWLLSTAKASYSLLNVRKTACRVLEKGLVDKWDQDALASEWGQEHSAEARKKLFKAKNWKVRDRPSYWPKPNPVEQIFEHQSSGPICQKIFVVTRNLHAWFNAWTHQTTKNSLD